MADVFDSLVFDPDVFETDDGGPTLIYPELERGVDRGVSRGVSLGVA